MSEAIKKINSRFGHNSLTWKMGSLKPTRCCVPVSKSFTTTDTIERHTQALNMQI